MLIYRPVGKYTCAVPKQKISRDALLEAVWSLVHERGYHATSIADVSRAAGIAKAGVLYHFGTKAGMMDAVLAWTRERYRRYVLSAFAKTGHRPDGAAWTLEARLAEVIRRQFHLATLNGQAGCFFGNTILETGGRGPFGEALRGFYDDWIAAATAALAERFDQPRSRRLADELFAGYQGTILLYKLDGDATRFTRFRESALALIAPP